MAKTLIKLLDHKRTFMRKLYRHASSFRDPSGFVFCREGVIYRQVNEVYEDNYNLLMSSGLYDSLVGKSMLVSHTQVESEPVSENCFCILQPQKIPFVSFPYEWSFGQLRDAAILTLDIQRASLEKGMSLKDASAYNIQFINGKPIFIDTLSFEKHKEGVPWVAYKQFCEHFLSPLLLMHHTDIRLNRLAMLYIDGVPLDLVSRLLPKKTMFNFAAVVHIHLHSMQQRKHASSSSPNSIGSKAFSLHAMLALVDNLRSAVTKLQWKPIKTEWDSYYASNNNYSDGSLVEKEKIVSEFLCKVSPKSVWDLGANNGRFSRIAANIADYVVSWDVDPSCTQRNYLNLKAEKVGNILPLLLDLSNPSANIGWANEERLGFIDRGGCDLILALGLIHHLAISNGIPLEMIAEMMAKICSDLVIEWVPKEDSQVKKMLSTRVDIFDRYSGFEFERVFQEHFSICHVSKIPCSSRVLYLMKSRETV